MKLVISAAIISAALLTGCKREGNGIVKVTVDLNKTAPIGYEICGDRGPSLGRGILDLKLLMPERIDIPSDVPQFGVKSVEFRPGRHEVDVYRNLHSARKVYTKGDLGVEAGCQRSGSSWTPANFPKAST